MEAGYCIEKKEYRMLSEELWRGLLRVSGTLHWHGMAHVVCWPISIRLETFPVHIIIKYDCSFY